MGQKELTIKYKYSAKDEDLGIGKAGEFTGKTGRADLFLKYNDDVTYLWEIKPISYKYEPRKTKGEEQLKKYVASDEEYYIGGYFIENDYFKRYFIIPRGGNTVEYITYTINYYNQGNGLILYTFTRESRLEENDDEKTNSNTSAGTGSFVATKVSSALAYLLGNIILDIPIPETPGETTDDPEETTTEESTEEVAGGTTGGVVGGTTEEEIPDDEPIAAIRYDEKTLLLLRAFAIVWSAQALGSDYNDTSIGKAQQALATNFLTSISRVSFRYNFSSNLTEEEIEEINTNADLMMDLIYALYGEDLVEELLLILEEGNQAKIDMLLEEIQNLDGEYEEASKVAPPRDPLIIDLGAEGIVLTTIEDGVNFDLDNNTFAEKTAWIGTEDGFLALDKNNNGIIDNGGELFGDEFIMDNGVVSSTGFDALASLDSNGDNVINSDDTRYAELLVWIDANHNGNTDSGELKTLAEQGISEISLDYTEESNVDTATGTMQAEYSTAICNDGAVKRVGEFWFKVNSSDTTLDGEKTTGNVPNILQAIEADEGGRLEELCLAFNNAGDISIKRKYLKEILYYVAGATDIEPNSRGGNIDARDLKVIEEFMGREFEGVDGANPNSRAADKLKAIYNNIENYYYTIINLESSFGGTVSIASEYIDSDGQRQVDIDALEYIINEKIQNGNSVDMFMYDSAVYLRSFDKCNGTDYYEQLYDYYSAISSGYGEIIMLAGSGNTYLGTSANDIFTGTGYNDFVFGEAGDDNISSGAGTDYIYGGTGDDILNGGQGDDVYYFEANHGNDQILDKDGDSKLIFLDGLSFDDYEIDFNSNQEMLLTHVETGQTINIKYYAEGKDKVELCFYDDTIIFDEGTDKNIIMGTPDKDTLSSSKELNIFAGKEDDDIIYGSANTDYIFGNDGDDQIYGANGYNIIFGGLGDDVIYDGSDTGYLRGGYGDDKIYAGGGSDTLDGGYGNDYLEGNHGDDTFVFKKDYGSDIIVDSVGDNTVKIYDYLMEDMRFYRNSQNALVVKFNDTEDVLTIEDFFTENPSVSYVFKLQDNTVINKSDIDAEYMGIKGTDGNDTLYGNDGNDILDGGAGDDSLNGGNGDDTYIFKNGYGNDIINDWGGNTILDMSEISVNDIVIAEQYGSNLIITIADTGDTIIFNGYKWNQGDFTIKLADDVLATINKDTFELELLNQTEVLDTASDTDAYISN